MRPRAIFRIEDATGRGPYNGMLGSLSDVHRSLGLEASGKERPCPEYDDRLHKGWRNLGSDRADFHFGFTSVRQAAEWIGKKAAADVLEARGFVIVQYRSTVYRVGSKQAVFRKKFSQCVGSRKPSSLFEGEPA